MSECGGERSARGEDVLQLGMASSSTLTQLQDTEKTRDELDKKTEMSTEDRDCRDNMVSDLEEKVLRSKRDRRNSLHRTQLLESQMRTVRGELVDTLGHLQALRDVLRRSQQKAEERQAAMEKLTAELR
ncbi:uncharacterized protein LOC143491466 [Brachyhypopomus gauderio]|uniref:uncharacterized protein LOC143491466 n=1 Tax=Brachyhypopomus gauderio TaxID=698409 RepID=UPI004042C78A